MASKPRPKPHPRSNVETLQIIEGVPNTFKVHYKLTHYRFLFDGGGVADVWAVVDDSYLREAVLNATGADGVVGVTTIIGDEVIP